MQRKGLVLSSSPAGELLFLKLTMHPTLIRENIECKIIPIWV